MHYHQELQTKIAELTTAAEKITSYNTTSTEKLLLLQQEIHLHDQVIQTQHKNINTQPADTFAFLCSTNAHYQELVQSKIALEKELQTHPYNPQEYAQQQKIISDIEVQYTEYESLRKEVAQQDNRKKTIHELCITIKKLKQDKVELEKQLDELDNLTAKLAILQEEESQLKNNLAIVRDKKDLLLQSQGSIENQQKQLEKVKVDYEVEQKNIIMLDGTIEDYQTISTATGKDGIQALLIEEAIPEIEQEANQLLSQLTNNQAQV